MIVLKVVNQEALYSWHPYVVARPILDTYRALLADVHPAARDGVALLARDGVAPLT